MNQHSTTYIVLLGLAAIIGGCGGGSDSGASASTTQSPAATPVPTPAPSPPPAQANAQATNAVIQYFVLANSSRRGEFVKQEEVISSNLSARGLYSSGTHYLQSSESFVASVNAALNDGVQVMAQSLRTQVLDRGQIRSQIFTLRDADIAYARAYYARVNWGLSQSGLVSFLAQVEADVAVAYQSAIIRLDAL